MTMCKVPRLFVLLLASLMLLLATTIPASAQDSTASTFTEGLIFKLNDDNCSYRVTGYVGQSTEVIIPKTYNGYPVTALNRGIFATNTSTSTGSDTFEPSFSDDGSTILPEDTLGTTSGSADSSTSGNTGAVPTKITIYAKSIDIPNSADALPSQADICGFFGSTAHTYAKTYSRTFIGTPSILSARIELGDDFTIRYSVNLGTVAPENVTMRFTTNEKTTVVVGQATETANYYAFSFKGIGPHMMGDNVRAELLVNGTVVDVVENYSIRQYCLNMLDCIKNENIPNYTAEKYAPLKTLIADLLQYGADAQVYTNYNTSALVNESITGMSEYVSPGNTYANLNFSSSIASDNSRLISATVELSNVIRLRFAFATSDASKITVKIGNNTYGPSAFIDAKMTDAKDLPIYMVYSDAIYATQIEDNYTVSLLVDDKECQTLMYSVLNYIYRKQNDANTQLASLVKSIRNYGSSAIALNEYDSRSGTAALYLANDNLTYVNDLYRSLQRKFEQVDLKSASDSVSSVFNTTKYDVVIVAGVDTMSPAATAAMDTYLNNSGRVLLLGGPALEKPYKVGNEYLTLAEYRENKISTLTDNSKSVVLAVKDNMSQAPSGGTIITPTVGDYGLANSKQQLRFSIDNLTNYAILQKFGIKVGLSSANALSFYAKAGDERTNVFTLEIANDDDSTWRAKIALTDEWTHYTLLAEDFTPRNNSTTGTPNFTEITVVKICFEMSYSKLSEGAHSLYISDIAMVDVQGDSAFTAQSNNINGVAPLYEQYPITNAADISADEGQVFVSDRNYVIPKGTNALVSRYPGITAEGYGKDTDIRFIPLLTVTDKNGLFSGYAAWIDLYATQTTANGSREGSMVGYFGAATDEFYNTDGIAAVVEAATAMTGNAFIVDAGTTEHTYLPEDTNIVTGVKFVTFDNDDGENNVTATVSLYQKDTLLAQYTSDDVTSSSLANSIQKIQKTYYRSNITPDRVVATLNVNGKVVDRVEQNIYYWEPKENPSFIYTEDGYFKYKKDGYGKIINFFGINYFPSYLGAAPDDATTKELNKVTSRYDSWHSDDGYDPAVIANDLKRFKDIGMNAVAIQVDTNFIDSTNNLLDFLRICEELDIYVDVYLDAYPLKGFNEKAVKTAIDKLHLYENDRIIAYDIAWEERVGNYAGGGGGAANGRFIGRAAWDDQWVDWVKVQYGSVSAALNAWGNPTGLNESNLVITDAMIDYTDKDEKYKKVVAAYQRFIDDMVSMSMQENFAKIQSFAPDQLISFRMSMSGSTRRAGNYTPSMYCFDFQSLASTMAFMEPEGYALAANDDACLQVMFANAYARYAKPDAPVVWKEFGKSVWAYRDNGNFYQNKAALAAGAEYYEYVLDYCLKSYTSGIFCWWSIPGYRANEDSDYGIINPDGSDRGEITALLREYAPKFKNQGERKDTVYITVDRDDYVGGLFGMFDEVKSQLAAAYKAGKSVTFIDKSQKANGSYSYADTLLNKYVGDAVSSSTGKAPLRYVNGIVKSVVNNGDGTATVTVCNTKQTIWRAGTVSLVSTDGSDFKVDHTFTKDVGYLEDVTFDVAISGNGTIELRLEINGVPFGPLYTTTIQ